MSTTTTQPQLTALPTGTWKVDPQAGEVTFASRGMFGLVPVKGAFAEFEGNVSVKEEGVKGDLRIRAASLDTGNQKRDDHLRGDDFFAVEESPEVNFTLTGVDSSSGALSMNGVLQIRDTQLEIVTPLQALLTDTGRLELSTTLDVDRAAAGVGWSKMGMIKGQAHLHVTLVLDAQ